MLDLLNASKALTGKRTTYPNFEPTTSVAYSTNSRQRQPKVSYILLLFV